ncbi:MAG: ATP-binding protein, partial [Chloroflexota bacterium]|nr:ATP-binding protein [Chloroflexota bacterium]
MSISRKTEIGPLDGTPEKRMFWSIISDYDLITGVSELVDNAIDLWMQRSCTEALTIDITLDSEQQFISVTDNAGGVKRDDLRLLIAPGGSTNDRDSEVIGIFGVGGKRASIALGEHVEVKTRTAQSSTYQLDITKDWLAVEDWEIPFYQIPDIEPGTTIVAISQLRKPLRDPDIASLVEHLSSTYGWFIREGCVIKVNTVDVVASSFNQWAYPEGYSPRRLEFKIPIDGDTVRVEVTAGLVTDRDAERDNYGVYIYCNHRLIVKELRTRDVGYFVSGEAGVPHPDASLCRAIVDLQGPAKLMPWNSSKNGISPGHIVFQKLRPQLIALVAHFSTLSRRLKNSWDEVESRDAGTIEPVLPEEVTPNGKLRLPPLPRVAKPRVERIKAQNSRVVKDRPWTVGLIEALAAVDVITRQRFDTKNRIALILLDS